MQTRWPTVERDREEAEALSSWRVFVTIFIVVLGISWVYVVSQVAAKDAGDALVLCLFYTIVVIIGARKYLRSRVPVPGYREDVIALLIAVVPFGMGMVTVHASLPVRKHSMRRCVLAETLGVRCTQTGPNECSCNGKRVVLEDHSKEGGYTGMQAHYDAPHGDRGPSGPTRFTGAQGYPGASGGQCVRSARELQGPEGRFDKPRFEHEDVVVPSDAKIVGGPGVHVDGYAQITTEPEQEEL